MVYVEDLELMYFIPITVIVTKADARHAQKGWGPVHDEVLQDPEMVHEYQVCFD